MALGLRTLDAVAPDQARAAHAELAAERFAFLPVPTLATRAPSI